MAAHVSQACDLCLGCSLLRKLMWEELSVFCVNLALPQTNSILETGTEGAKRQRTSRE